MSYIVEEPDSPVRTVASYGGDLVRAGGQAARLVGIPQLMRARYNFADEQDRDFMRTIGSAASNFVAGDFRRAANDYGQFMDRTRQRGNERMARWGLNRAQIGPGSSSRPYGFAPLNRFPPQRNSQALPAGNSVSSKASKFVRKVGMRRRFGRRRGGRRGGGKAVTFQRDAVSVYRSRRPSRRRVRAGKRKSGRYLAQVLKRIQPNKIKRLLTTTLTATAGTQAM